MMPYLCLLLTFLSAPTAQDTGSDRWEKAIRAFEESDKQNPPPRNGILFIGSSSIRMWNLEKSFPDLALINRGFGGSQISDSNAFIDRIVVPYTPKVVVLYAGDNDVARGKSPDVVNKDFQKFVQLVHAKLPGTPVLFIAIKPSLARWKLYPTMDSANKLIRDLAAMHDGITYVDIATPMLASDGRPLGELFLKDGLHLNERGYEVWTKVLRPILNKHDPKRINANP